MNAKSVMGCFIATRAATYLIEKAYVRHQKIRDIVDRVIPKVLQSPLYALCWQNLPYAVALTKISLDERLEFYNSWKPFCEDKPSVADAPVYLFTHMFVICFFRSMVAGGCKVISYLLPGSSSGILSNLEEMIVPKFNLGRMYVRLNFYTICVVLGAMGESQQHKLFSLDLLQEFLDRVRTFSLFPRFESSQNYSSWKENAIRTGVYPQFLLFLKTNLACYLCSLTGDLALCPVREPNGRIYEMSIIEKRLADKRQEYPFERLLEMKAEERKQAFLEFCPFRSCHLRFDLLEYDPSYHPFLIRTLRTLMEQPLDEKFKEGLISYAKDVYINREALIKDMIKTAIEKSPKRVISAEEISNIRFHYGLSSLYSDSDQHSLIHGDVLAPARFA